MRLRLSYKNVVVSPETPFAIGSSAAPGIRWLARIIGHLKLTFVAERPPPPQVAFQEYLMAAEAGGEYFKIKTIIQNGN